MVQCCWFLWCVRSICLFYEVLYQGSFKGCYSLRLFICWSCLIALDAEVIGWHNLMCACRRYFLGLLYVAWTGHLLGFSYFTSRGYWLWLPVVACRDCLLRLFGKGLCWGSLFLAPSHFMVTRWQKKEKLTKRNLETNHWKGKKGPWVSVMDRHNQSGQRKR